MLDLYETLHLMVQDRYSFQAFTKHFNQMLFSNVFNSSFTKSLLTPQNGNIQIKFSVQNSFGHITKTHKHLIRNIPICLKIKTPFYINPGSKKKS